MTAKDKLNFIREAALKLSQLPYEERRLALRTFGIPDDEFWQETDPYAFALKHLELASEPNLKEIHEYITNSQPEPAGSIERLGPETIGPWKQGMFRLFASHLAKEKKYASELKLELYKYGIDMFVAHEDIEPVSEWLKEIEKALNTCDAMIAIMHDGFHESKWTDQEIGVCVGRRVPIIPLTFSINPYGFIGKYQALKSGGRNVQDIAYEIFKLLASSQLSGLGIASGLVAMLETATSFETANRIAGYLISVKTWTPDLLRRLEAAPQINDQVRGGYLVQGYIDNIIAANTPVA